MALVLPENAAPPADPAGARLEATLATLPDEWLLLPGRSIGTGGPRAGFVLLHAEIGVALVDLAPWMPDRAMAALEDALTAEQVVGPRDHLPIVGVTVALSEIETVGERLAAAFERVPACDMADGAWPRRVIDLLLDAEDAAMAPLARRAASPAPRLAPPDLEDRLPEPKPRRGFAVAGTILGTLVLLGGGAFAYFASTPQTEPLPTVTARVAVPASAPALPNPALPKLATQQSPPSQPHSLPPLGAIEAPPPQVPPPVAAAAEKPPPQAALAAPPPVKVAKDASPPAPSRVEAPPANPPVAPPAPVETVRKPAAAPATQNKPAAALTAEAPRRDQTERASAPPKPEKAVAERPARDDTAQAEARARKAAAARAEAAARRQAAARKEAQRAAAARREAARRPKHQSVLAEKPQRHEAEKDVASLTPKAAPLSVLHEAEANEGPPITPADLPPLEGPNLPPPTSLLSAPAAPAPAPVGIASEAGFSGPPAPGKPVMLLPPVRAPADMPPPPSMGPAAGAFGAGLGQR